MVVRTTFCLLAQAMTMVSRALELPPPYTRAAPAYSPATSSAASSLFSADSSDSNVYEYGSKNTALRFSQHKRAGVRLPSYGREGVVDGEIYLRSTNHVESVTVSLRGEVKTTIESSTRPNFTSKLTLLDQPRVIWSGSNQVDIPIPHTIPFSFLFPIKSKERDEALPPSFIGALAEGTIRVKYTIVAHVRRKGWRGNTTIETEVFYLPRPLQPMLSPDVVNLETLRTPVESPYDARVVELPVKQSIAGKQVTSGVKVHFACPLAVYLSTDSSVPFSLSLSSPTSPLEHLMQLAPHISVRLVRTTTIIARGLSHSEEMTCAHGVLHPPERYDELADQSVLATGSLAITDTTWTSWGIEGAARISYALRVTLPTSFQPELAYFDHKIPIRGLSGSYGASTSPDFSLVPTPATLLKKAVGYMPMRV